MATFKVLVQRPGKENLRRFQTPSVDNLLIFVVVNIAAFYCNFEQTGLDVFSERLL